MEVKKMTLYEMTPAQIWAAWKNQELTVNDVLSYQAYAGIYFNPDGTYTTGGR
jgi:hypothetical protein